MAKRLENWMWGILGCRHHAWRKKKKKTMLDVSWAVFTVKDQYSKEPFPKNTYEKQSLEVVALYMQFTDGDLLLSCN